MGFETTYKLDGKLMKRNSNRFLLVFSIVLGLFFAWPLVNQWGEMRDKELVHNLINASFFIGAYCIYMLMFWVANRLGLKKRQQVFLTISEERVQFVNEFGSKHQISWEHTVLIKRVFQGYYLCDRRNVKPGWKHLFFGHVNNSIRLYETFERFDELWSELNKRGVIISK